MPLYTHRPFSYKRVMAAAAAGALARQGINKLWLWGTPKPPRRKRRYNKSRAYRSRGSYRREYKYTTNDLSNLLGSSNVTTAGIGSNLSDLIVEGTNVNTRNGRRVNLKGLSLRGTFKLGAGETESQVRVLVYIKRSGSTVTPTFSGIITPKIDGDLLKVVANRYYVLDVGTTTVKRFNIPLRIPQSLVYDATTGASQRVEISVFFVGQGYATNPPTISEGKYMLSWYDF